MKTEKKLPMFSRVFSQTKRKTFITTFIILCCIFLGLLVFSLNLRKRKPINYPSGTGGVGFGSWIPGNIDYDKKRSMDRHHPHDERTTFYMEKRDQTPSTEACNCRWMINLFRNPSYTQKTSDIGWLKGRSNGFEIWHAELLSDIETDRSLLNVLGITSASQKRLSARFTGSSTIEIKHVQGCDRCFGSGRIKFGGWEDGRQFNNNRVGEVPFGNMARSREMKTSSQFALNQRQSEYLAFYESHGAIDYIRFTISSQLTASIERKNEYMVYKSGRNESKRPWISAACYCKNKTCDHPVEAYMRTHGKMYFRALDRLVFPRTDDEEKREMYGKLKDRLIRLSSPEMKPRTKKLLKNKAE